MKATFQSMDDVQLWVFRELLAAGKWVAPRSRPTLELTSISFLLEDVRSRIVTSLPRKWSLPLALGEFCWHARGANDVASMEYYSPKWRDFSEEGFVLGSCYGHHIFSNMEHANSQW